jgi:hypothetical protein
MANDMSGTFTACKSTAVLKDLDKQFWLNEAEHLKFYHEELIYAKMKEIMDRQLHIEAKIQPQHLPQTRTSDGLKKVKDILSDPRDWCKKSINYFDGVSLRRRRCILGAIMEKYSILTSDNIQRHSMAMNDIEKIADAILRYYPKSVDRHYDPCYITICFNDNSSTTHDHVTHVLQTADV